VTIDTVLSGVHEKFGPAILGVSRHSARRVYVDIAAKDIVEMTRYLFKELGLRFAIASAVDEFEGFEILYHFVIDAAGAVVTVRVVLPDRAHPAIDTITTVTQSAWWIEREMHELFGIEFNGNKDLRRLLLADDWPDGVYPMRKDFVPPKRDSRKS